MKIRRFNESEAIEISEDRVSDIIVELTELNTLIDERNSKIESLISELDNFKNSSFKNNDQIDDNIALLQILSKNLEEGVDGIDSIVSNFESYLNDGRKYLYTETK